MKETFDSVNEALSDARKLALKQSIHGKQLVLMTDASSRSAGYALMIEDKPDQKIQSRRESYAPVAFGSKFFSPAQLKLSVYSREILAIYMAFLESAHILCEATKPTIVLTDNKSVTQFFQTEAIPPFCGTHANMYCSATSQKHISLVQSTEQLPSLPIRIECLGEDPSENRGGCTNNGHCPLRSRHAAQMLQMRSNFCSHRQMVKTRLMKKPLRGKGYLGKRQ